MRASASAPPNEWQTLICLPIATSFEIFGSLIWGGYHYRLHNIPLYVPPGHALVYVFGITAGTLPLVRRLPEAIRASRARARDGVDGRRRHGAPADRTPARPARRGPLAALRVVHPEVDAAPTMFAAIWIATATLEIAGTLAGAWTWAAVTPWSHLASGNPPSAIAAGYAVIDGSVALAASAPRCRRSRGLRRRAQPRPAQDTGADAMR